MQLPISQSASRGEASQAISWIIRTPAEAEIPAILEIFESEVRAGKMLPRSPEEIRARLADWLIATDGDAIAGCVSLVFFNAELCEVRSLAVHPTYRGLGLGSILINASLRLGRQRNMKRALTLTRATKLFELAGFERDLVGNFPEKVWKDCAPCPLRERCDEVALIYQLDQIDLSDSNDMNSEEAWKTNKSIR